MMTYDRGYTVHSIRYGDVRIPDQVYERMALWDQIGMPVPAIQENGRVVEILLTETDA